MQSEGLHTLSHGGRGPRGPRGRAARPGRRRKEAPLSVSLTVESPMRKHRVVANVIVMAEMWLCVFAVFLERIILYWSYECTLTTRFTIGVKNACYYLLFTSSCITRTCAKTDGTRSKPRAANQLERSAHGATAAGRRGLDQVRRRRRLAVELLRRGGLRHLLCGGLRRKLLL